MQKCLSLKHKDMMKLASSSSLFVRPSERLVRTAQFCSNKSVILPWSDVTVPTLIHTHRPKTVYLYKAIWFGFENKVRENKNPEEGQKIEGFPDVKSCRTFAIVP
jgi:hypothetical protein